MSVSFSDEKVTTIQGQLNERYDFGTVQANIDKNNSSISFSFTIDNSIKDLKSQQEIVPSKDINSKNKDTVSDRLENKEQIINDTSLAIESFVNDNDVMKNIDSITKENKNVIKLEVVKNKDDVAKTKINDRSNVEIKNDRKDTSKDVVTNNKKELKLNDKSQTSSNDKTSFDNKNIKNENLGTVGSKNGDNKSQLGMNNGDKGDNIRSLNNGMLKYRPTLKYPSQARRFGTQGTVVMILLVDVQGNVVSVDIEKSSGSSLLDKSAQNYGKDFKFYPYDINGNPSSFKVRVPVKYQLR